MAEVIDETLRSNVVVWLTVEEHKKHIGIVRLDFLGQQRGQDVRSTNQSSSSNELLGAQSNT